jgi:hypothetical protein
MEGRDEFSMTYTLNFFSKISLLNGQCLCYELIFLYLAPVHLTYVLTSTN